MLYLQKQRHHSQARTLITGAGETFTAAPIPRGAEFPRLTRCLLHRAVSHVLWPQQAGLPWARGQPRCPGCLQLLLSSRPNQQVLVLRVGFAAAALHGEAPVG